MSKRSMAATAPDKMKDIDDKNPENKKPQSIQDQSYLHSAVKQNKIDQKNNKAAYICSFII